MSKAVDFLNKTETYFFATVEDGEARVSPIGFTVEFNGRVSF